MKIYAIVKNEDMQIACQLVGIEAVCVYTPTELKRAYAKALADHDIAILAVEADFLKWVNTEQTTLLGLSSPLIVPLPL